MNSIQHFAANQSAFSPVAVNRREPATHNESAEQLLLACQFAVPKLIPIVTKLGITPEDFCEFGHAEIQSALVNQWNRHRNILAAEIVPELKATLGKEVNPVLMLFEIIGEYVPTQDWRFYCERVSQASYARLLDRHNSAFSRALRNRANKPADIEELRQEHEAERLAMIDRMESVL